MSELSPPMMRDVSGRDDAEPLLAGLHELAERLQSASNYVEALRVHATGSEAIREASFAEAAAQELHRAAKAFRGLRDHLAKSPR